MDSFIDKFAQRKNAQEMIRANAMAEAEEKKRMEARLSEYEKIMQEMRQCSLLNMENAEKVRETLAASLAKIEKVQEKDGEERALLEKLAAQVSAFTEQMTEFAEKQRAQMTKFAEEQRAQMTEFEKEQRAQIAKFAEEQQRQTTDLIEKQQKQQEAQTKSIEELLRASDDFGHKEAVKVYRNVQAVIEGALPKQTEEITAAVKSAEEKKKTPTGMIVLWVLTFAAAAANTAIEVMRILGYL